MINNINSFILYINLNNKIILKFIFIFCILKLTSTFINKINFYKNKIYLFIY